MRISIDVHRSSIVSFAVVTKDIPAEPFICPEEAEALGLNMGARATAILDTNKPEKGPHIIFTGLSRTTVFDEVVFYVSGSSPVRGTVPREYVYPALGELLYKIQEFPIYLFFEDIEEEEDFLYIFGDRRGGE